MRWNGETYEQWLKRKKEWHEVFAYWPTQMDDGQWVWLEYYDCKWFPNCRGGTYETKFAKGISR